LVQAIINIIDSKNFHNSNETNAVSCHQIHGTTNISVSSLLQKLLNIKSSYLYNGIVPCLDNTFDKHLFNTFLCYIDHKLYFPYNLNFSTDNRGTFVEIIKLNSGGQVSFSTTEPGNTRGNHFHTRKAERFAVIKGRARIDIRRIGTSKTLSFELNGNQASFVDMPIWHTHSITNIGDEDLFTVFWINEHFDPDDADTFFETV
jgi:UDP-2-acetamido-2,6-beta-L-arabino-hexul-4-ose reductase